MAKKKRSLLSTIFSSVSSKLGFGASSGYNATDPRRKLISSQLLLSQNRATANQLLSASLPVLRAYCRQLDRNNATARAAGDAIAASIVGTGIALEPDTGDKRVDDLIRPLWNEFCKNADVRDRDIYTLQLEAARELAFAGEAVWRIVVDADTFGGAGKIPLRVLPLEGEWLPDEMPNNGTGITWVSGIALDDYARPVKYLFVNPETGKEEEVEANRVIHIFESRRALQCRGEPWLSPVIETLLNERDLVDAELYAAKQTAAMAIAITSESHDDPDTTEDGDATDPAQALRVGGVARLYPGEKVESLSHTRPSQQIAPFRQMLRGDIAAALKIPQRSMDRDPSRANYSSMRADNIDQEKLMGPVREWFGHASIGAIYKAVLPFLALKAGVAVPNANYKLLPDGQPYVDPQKDAQAALIAIAGGLSTYETEIAKRGGDWQKVWEQLKKEHEMAEKLGLKLVSDGKKEPKNDQKDEEKPEKEDEKADETDQETEEESRQMRQFTRFLEVARSTAPAIPAPVVNVLPASAPNVEVRNMIPDQPAPVVNVSAPEVKVRNEIPAPIVTVAAPVVNVEAPSVKIRNEPAKVSVVTPKPEVTINNEVIVPSRTVKATPQSDGSVIMEPQDLE